MNQFKELAEKIQQGDTQAEERLYYFLKEKFERKFWKMFSLADIVHEQFAEFYINILLAIRNNTIQNLDTGLSYAVGTMLKMRAHFIQELVKGRERSQLLRNSFRCPLPSPLENVLHQEKRSVVDVGLAKLKENERELLVRFYLLNQSKEDITKELGISHTQFRVNKHKAKSKLETAVTKHLGFSSLAVV